jgi:pilus assembly protein CpaC
MVGIPIRFVLCLSLGCFITAGSNGQAGRPELPGSNVTGQDSANEMTVSVGKAVLMDFAQPIQRIAIGLSDIAEATATSPTEIMLNGKAPGQTSLIVWQRGGDRQFFNVTVRRSAYDANDRLEAVRRELRKELPNQAVTVTFENGSIFLRGNVKDLTSSNRAVEIASTALASGPSADASAKGPGLLAAGDASTGKVVNLLYVDVPKAEKQILLKVRFASLDRTKARQLGINIFSLGLGNTVGGITTGQFSPPMISGSSGPGSSGSVSTTGYQATFTNELNFLAFFPGLNGGADIQALETKGVVEVLAQPNLVASNGKQASFLAGGEYPYPVAQAGAGGTGTTITIMFKEYGVRLNFIPTITPRGSIRLQVAPEVSSLDFTNAVTISGFTVPAISSRKVKTEVELGQGQSFVIGGLLDNRETETFEKIPFLSNIPVLGKFFESQSKNRINTELIVLVTPELVDPIPAGAPLPEIKYPDKFLPENSGIPMHTPENRDGSSVAPAPETMPVEKLVDSMKPEKPLIIDGGFSPSAAQSSTSSGGTTPP